MRLLLIISFFCSFYASAQSETEYSDEDLENFITISQGIQELHQKQASSLDSAMQAIGLEKYVFEEMAYDYKLKRSLDSLSPKFTEQEIKSFYYIMSFRQFQIEQMPSLIEAEAKKHGMSEDYFQHMAMRIQNIPSLQKRITSLSIKH